MACTEAVETVVGEHYNEQLRELYARYPQPSGELAQVVNLIQKSRDEELEHLHVAVEQDAKQSIAYPLLSGMIQAGCRAAIWLTKRW